MFERDFNRFGHGSVVEKNRGRRRRGRGGRRSGRGGRSGRGRGSGRGGRSGRGIRRDKEEEDSDKGTALETLFVITCTGWLDEGASIKRETQASENSTFVYTIVATSEGKEYTLSSSTSPETPSLFLPPGDHLNDYMLLVTSNICDEYDECAQHNMQLQVKRLTVETIKQTLENLTQPTSYLYMLANRGETKQVIQKLLLFLPYLNDLDDSKEKLVFSLISAAKSLNELKGLKKSIILKFVTGAEQDGGASDVSHIHTAACLSAPLPSSPGEKEKELSFEV
uniref:PKD/REJ-like domain-containing protein n=1 Tax=Eptatretus burgeri TaxID=7764 RepID=A0A8C4WY36_EPTBU